MVLWIKVLNESMMNPEHGSECNYSTLTFNGVDLMGERLADEVFWKFYFNPPGSSMHWFLSIPP